MASRKEYELAIKIAGKIDESLGKATGLTKKQLSEIAKQASKTNSTMSEQINSAFKGMDKGFEKIEKVVKRAATAVATIGVAGAAAATHVGMAFESQMSTVQAISGSSDTAMERLGEKAKEMGIKTQFSATEAGKAMEYMAMAGWKTEDMLNGVDGIMNLAAASGEELASTSDIVTDALTAFNLKAKDSTMFADVLAAAASNSNTNVSMLGESFKYIAPVAGAFGFSVQDVSVALGLMANSGIKGSMAGTALRKMLTNLAKPSKDVVDAMETLGVVLDDGHGKMKSFREIMLDLRKGMSGLKGGSEEYNQSLQKLDSALQKGELSETQYAQQLEALNMKYFEAAGVAKARAAAQLAGQTGMSGLLAIANASEEDFNKLTAAIDNSAGAAEKMANIRLDNLQGDITLAKSALEGLGIQIYEGFSDTARGAVQLFSKEIAALTKRLSILSTKVPTIKRELTSGAEAGLEFAKPLLNLGSWFLKNPRVISSALIGIGAAMATFKTISTVHKLTEGVMGLAAAFSNPVTGVVVGTTAAVGAIAAFTAAYKSWQKEVGQKNLSNHFGNLILNLKDLESIASYMVDNGSLSQLDEAMSAFSDVGKYIEKLNSATGTLKKLNWKVELGLQLNEDEKQSYKDAVESYIKNAQSAMEQEHFAMNLNVQLMTKDDLQGQQVRDQFNKFYSSNEAELEDLGKKLQDAVNTAFDDGLLTIDEEKHIQELQQQMANIQQRMASSDFTAELELTGQGLGQLDADSFTNLIESVGKAEEAATEKYKEAEKQAIKGAVAQYQAGAISKSEYEDMVDGFKTQYLAQVGEIQAKGTGKLAETVLNQYSTEMESLGPRLSQALDSSINNSFGQWHSEHDWTIMAQESTDALMHSIQQSLHVDNGTKQAMSQLWKELEPRQEELLATVQKYQEAGQQIPQSVSRGLHDAATVGAMAGDTDAMWYLVGERAQNNPQYAAIIQSMQAKGQQIPAALAAGMASNSSAASQAATTVWNQTQGAINSVFSRPILARAQINLVAAYSQSPNVLSNQARAKAQAIVNQKFATPFTQTVKIPTPKLPGLASGGIVERPTTVNFAEDSPEAAIPLNGSVRSKSLWKTAGERLGVLGTDNSTSNLNNSGYTINYAPTQNFAGQAPSKSDIIEANKLSMKEFEKMMQKYMKDQRRFNLA